MITLRTSEERMKKKESERKKRDAKIMNRYNTLLKEYKVSDAMIVVANEFNVSMQTIYNIRKRYDSN